MDAEKYSRNINLLCPTCGSDLFEYETGSEMLRCGGCQREILRDELIRENSESISEHAKEIAKVAAKDAAEELRAALKKAFKGSKHIKIK